MHIKPSNPRLWHLICRLHQGSISPRKACRFIGYKLASPPRHLACAHIIYATTVPGHSICLYEGYFHTLADRLCSCPPGVVTSIPICEIPSQYNVRITACVNSQLKASRRESDNSTYLSVPLHYPTCRIFRLYYCRWCCPHYRETPHV